MSLSALSGEYASLSLTACHGRKAMIFGTEKFSRYGFGMIFQNPHVYISKLNRTL